MACRRFWRFQEAREYVRNLNLGSCANWRRWSKTQRPDFIPSRPELVYKDGGFVSGADFVGYPSRQLREYDLSPDVLAFAEWQRQKLRFAGEGTEFVKDLIEQTGTYEVFRLPRLSQANLLFRPSEHFPRGDDEQQQDQWVPLSIRTTTCLADRDRRSSSSFAFNNLGGIGDMPLFCLYMSRASIDEPSENEHRKPRGFCFRGTDIVALTGSTRTKIRIPECSTTRASSGSVFSNFEIELTGVDIRRKLDDWWQTCTRYHSTLGAVESLCGVGDSVGVVYRRICNLYRTLYEPAGLRLDPFPVHIDPCQPNAVLSGRRFLHGTAFESESRYRVAFRRNIGQNFRRPHTVESANVDYFVSIIRNADSEELDGIFVHPKEALLHLFSSEEDGTSGTHAVALYPPWCAPTQKKKQRFQKEHMQYFIDLREDSENIRKENVRKLRDILRMG